MKNLLLFATLLLPIVGVARAEADFKPHIIDSEDSEICELVLDHYSRLFKSDAKNTRGLSASERVRWPDFVDSQVEGVRGQLKTAEVDFYGTKKLFVYHERSHSWRGEIYTGYMVSPDQKEALNAQLKERGESDIPAFYPMGSLVSGRTFTWWENLPFQFEGEWYVLGDYGDFYRKDSIRKIYKVEKDGTSSAVCSIKIFQNFDDQDLSEKLPFFSAYKESVEKIMLSPGNCGTSRPEASAKSEGRFFASMAIFRPWAVDPSWKEIDNETVRRRIDFQRKHFEDWKYQDVWSYREHETYENLAFDAVSELKDHYIKNYSYSAEEALSHASKVVDSMPGRYYSLGVYYNEEKDFSFFQEMLNGGYKNWAKLEKDLELSHGTYPLVSLSLMVDNPEQYENLPPDLGLGSVKTFYNKDILMFAAHMNNYDAVKYLVDNGWSVANVTSHEDKYMCGPKLERLNRSALTYAAENASAEVMMLLVDAGADVNIEDSQGNPLEYYLQRNPRFSEDASKTNFKDFLKGRASVKEVKPSFSCQSATNRIEKAICNSLGLSIYDRELNRSYEKASKGAVSSETLKKSQINWIKRRRSECGRFSESAVLNACLARTTRARIRYLRYLHSSL